MRPRPSTVAPVIGLAEWRLPTSGIEAIRLASALGASGLQVDLGGPGRGVWLDTPGRIRKLRAESESTGVRLLAVAGNHLNDVGLTAAQGSAGAAQVTGVIERLLDSACELAAPLAFVPSFRRSAIENVAALNRTAEVLRWAATQAQARGLILANENVVPPHWARILLDDVGSTAFQLLLDTYNPVTVGMDPVRLVQEVEDGFADQIHLKSGAPGSGDRSLYGTGNDHSEATLTAMRQQQLPIHALVLENDYRDGDLGRLRTDLAWARQRAMTFIPHEIGTDV